MLAPSLNPRLRDFWETPVNDNGDPVRNRVLYGGRASSKSHDTAGFLIFLAQAYRVRVLCARQFQNRIAESSKALLDDKIEQFGLSGDFISTDTMIRHKRTGSEFIFYGLWRHITEIKSLEGIDLCWIEEAHNLTEEQWEVLNPTVRKEGSQFILTFNPQLATDFVWKRFVINPPRGTLVRSINFNENPFLSRTMLDVIEAARAEDEDDFNHIYLGVPRDDDDNAIIKRSWIMAAIDAHKTLGITPTGSNRIGFDVADGGKDKCATIHAHGPLAAGSDLWKAGEHELLKSCTRVWSAAGERGAHIVYDSIGVGASAGAKFNELNEGVHPTRIIQHSGFNAGGKVFRPQSKYANTDKSNEDMFANIKAQAWWSVADRLRNTFNAVRNGAKFDQSDMIFIDGELPYLSLLIDELATPKRDFDNTGKVKVESKRELAKANREGGPMPSPNLADAFVMAFAPGHEAMVFSDEVLAAL